MGYGIKKLFISLKLNKLNLPLSFKWLFNQKSVHFNFNLLTKKYDFLVREAMRYDC